jgi:hypothetical protein
MEEEIKCPFETNLQAMGNKMKKMLAIWFEACYNTRVD